MFSELFYGVVGALLVWFFAYTAFFFKENR